MGSGAANNKHNENLPATMAYHQFFLFPCNFNILAKHFENTESDLLDIVQMSCLNLWIKYME